jgi:hypothetical protein
MKKNMTYLVVAVAFYLCGSFSGTGSSYFIRCDWRDWPLFTEFLEDIMIEFLQGNIPLLLCVEEGGLFSFKPLSLVVCGPRMASHIRRKRRGNECTLSRKNVLATWPLCQTLYVKRVLKPGFIYLRSPFGTVGFRFNV